MTRRGGRSTGRFWRLVPATLPRIYAGDSADVAHFSISANGVLSFKFAPDYENPRGQPRATGNENTYRVVVVAADEPQGAANRELGYQKVTVNVTNCGRTGNVTRLDARCSPRKTGSLVAIFDIDDDASDTQKTAAKWKWEHSESKGRTVGCYPYWHRSRGIYTR